VPASAATTNPNQLAANTSPESSTPLLRKPAEPCRQLLCADNRQLHHCRARTSPQHKAEHAVGSCCMVPKMPSLHKARDAHGRVFGVWTGGSSACQVCCCAPAGKGPVCCRPHHMSWAWQSSVTAAGLPPPSACQPRRPHLSTNISACGGDAAELASSLIPAAVTAVGSEHLITVDDQEAAS
jgi:hypothetical protein